MTEIERTSLARERTHAAWLRTCLSFVVALAALCHYAFPNPGIADTVLAVFLIVGGTGSARRALEIAPDLTTKIYALALMLAPATAIAAFR